MRLDIKRIELLAIIAVAGSVTVCAAADPVSTWNELAVQATLTAGEGAVPQSRTLAMVQIAIHDALNSIEPRYRRYALTGDFQIGASTEAAIAAAGHDALVAAITLAASAGFGTRAQQATAVRQADAERDAELAAIPESRVKSAGIAIGQAAAAAIVNLRTTDHAASASQVPHCRAHGRAIGNPHPIPIPPVRREFRVVSLLRSPDGDL